MAATEKPPPPPGKALRGYDETYLLCRNLGHTWEIMGYFRGAPGQVWRDLQCQRCGTERTDRWLRSGERIAGRYNYADNYKLETDGRMVAIDVRLEVIRRATVYANEETMLAEMGGRGRK